MLKREKAFLDAFCEFSPLSVPKFDFFGKEVLGYRKIVGQKLTADLFKTLSKKQKAIVAKDLGQFLSTLHSFEYTIDHRSEYRNFFTKAGLDRLIPKIQKIILPSVSEKTRTSILAFLSEVESNAANFNHKEGITHTDLYHSHIYWDQKHECISGIIDFGEVSKNAITMDFTLLANFIDPKNDAFLEDLLLVYDNGDAELFRKIKTFSKLEKLYWPVEDMADSLIDPGKLEDFKKNLQKVSEIFAD